MVIDKLEKREAYSIFRKRNRIRLVDVAEYCKCTSALLSLWENGKANLSKEKEIKYDEYIKLFEERKIYTHN